MKFFSLAAIAAVASANQMEAQEGATIQLNSKMQLVSAALQMTNSRAEAHLLLKEAVKTFEHAHSRSHAHALSEKLDAQSSLVSVPIDEKKALNLKVSPTFAADTVQSVTLKAFRKIVGYDTFDSIRKQDRNEIKDPADYYNVTVSMLVQRKPTKAAEFKDIPLTKTLDRGFPYDD